MHVHLHWCNPSNNCLSGGLLWVTQVSVLATSAKAYYKGKTIKMHIIRHKRWLLSIGYNINFFVENIFLKNCKLEEVSTHLQSEPQLKFPPQEDIFLREIRTGKRFHWELNAHTTLGWVLKWRSVLLFIMHFSVERVVSTIHVDEES